MTCTVRQTRPDRPALTLLELIVVMVILIGLAGIIVPLLPSMLTRTHTSTASTNFGEIAKAIQSYQQLNLSFPDYWDSLVDTTGALATYVPGNVPASYGGPYNYITTYPLTAGDGIAATLSAAGINNVFQFVTTPADPTFYPYAAVMPVPPANVIPTATPIATGVTLAVLTTAGAQKLNLDYTATLGGGTGYVVLGLGKYNQMFGRVAVDAPVHFSDDPNQNPEKVYARYALVFKVMSGSTGTPPLTPLPQAVLVASIDLSLDSGVAGIDDHIQEFYQTVNGAK